MSKKRSDTPLLQECFAIAGRQNRESVVEWKKRIAACLEAAGAWMLPEERGENEISFRTGDADGGRSYRYRLQILPLQGQMKLVQSVEMENLKRRKQLLQWYAGKRNQKLGKHIRYQLFPVRLEGTVGMKKGWEMELIRLVSEMSRILLEDEPVLCALYSGSVPPAIREELCREYQEYEREMSDEIRV